MANLMFNIAKSGLMNGTIDLDTHDIRVALCMTNTTADTDADADTVDAITTLDECDATDYARQALTTETVQTDDDNDRADFSSDDPSFTGLGGDATRDIQGALVLKHVTNDTDSIPICFVDFTSDIPSTATQVDIPFSTSDILRLA